MVSNSLKATLPSLQSTKVPREPTLMKMKAKIFLRASRGIIGTTRLCHCLHCLWQRHLSDLSAAPPLGSFRRPCGHNTSLVWSSIWIDHEYN